MNTIDQDKVRTPQALQLAAEGVPGEGPVLLSGLCFRPALYTVNAERYFRFLPFFCKSENHLWISFSYQKQVYHKSSVNINSPTAGGIPA